MDKVKELLSKLSKEELETLAFHLLLIVDGEWGSNGMESEEFMLEEINNNI